MTDQSQPDLTKAVRSDKEIVEHANELAKKLYLIMGYEAKPGHKFYEATHPLEVAAWEKAITAYDHIEGTDVEEAHSVMIDEMSEDTST